MKTLILILLCFLLGCTTTVKETNSVEMANGKPIKIRVFDGCEYVGFFDGSGYNYTYKGNCKYCMDRFIKIIQKYKPNNPQK